MNNIISIITASAKAIGVSPSLLTAMCFYESSFRPHIVTPHDGGSPSWGLCQLKLNTAREMIPTMTPALLMDPTVNSIAAAMYLKRQIKKCGGEFEGADSYNRGHCYKHIDTKYVRQIKHIIGSKPWIKSKSH